MKPNYLCVLLLLLNSQFFFAQEFELPEVSVEALLESEHPTEPDAIAAVLYNFAKTSFVLNGSSFDVHHEFTIRVKIYKKEALNLANYEVDFFTAYSNLNPDIIKFFEGKTYNLNDGVINITKTKSNKDVKLLENQSYSTALLALPNVKVGAIIEFKYLLVSGNKLTFPTFRFQRDIPVNYAQYKTEIPINYVYKPVVRGFIKVATVSKIERGGKKERAKYEQATTTHTASNIPSMADESFVDNMDNYRLSIDYELEVIKMPGKPHRYLTKTWSDVAESVYSNKNFGGQLKIKDYFEYEVQQVVKNLETREEKVNAVFSFLKAKMKWNKSNGVLTVKGVKQAYLNRTGNAAEINLTLCAMLNSLGILASPVLVSTINNGIATYPSRTAFNYVIASTEINGQRILLDATSPYTQPNIVPLKILNWTGTLINLGGSYEIIDMTPPDISKKVVNCSATIDQNGKIIGKARINKTDYEAFVFREINANVKSEEYLEQFENDYKGVIVSNYNLENKTDLKNPVIENFDFVYENAADIIQNQIYLSPTLFFKQLANPMKQEERKLPIYFGYPKQDRYFLEIEIPKGYVIESLPQSINIATGEEVASFKYNISFSGNKIQLIINTETYKMLVSQEFYPVLKDFYSQMYSKLNEKIVLKKA